MGARARNRRKSAKRVRSRRPRLIGYARVSIKEQSLDLQIDALRQAGKLR